MQVESGPPSPRGIPQNKAPTEKKSSPRPTRSLSTCGNRLSPVIKKSDDTLAGRVRSLSVSPGSLKNMGKRKSDSSSEGFPDIGMPSDVFAKKCVRLSSAIVAEEKIQQANRLAARGLILPTTLGLQNIIPVENGPEENDV